MHRPPTGALKRIGAIGPLTAVIACVAVLVAGCGSSPRHRASPRLVSIGAGIEGPAGLLASVYARGLPTVADFALDPAGRLWAAAAGLGRHSQDGVYLIAGAGATPRRVITGLDDPLGLAWHRGRLYVASVGRVTVYSDFTGTRFRQHRTLIRARSPTARTTTSCSPPTDAS
jgi:hypothetical protein